MFSYLLLFTSLSTLLCCALPSLLVLVGLGATVASIVTELPTLVFLSHHKNWVFAIAGVLIASNFLYVYVVAPRLQARSGACRPNDPACQTAGRMSRIILWFSGVVYLIGFFSAYLLGLLVKFDS
jgi:hypothetical protein